MTPYRSLKPIGIIILIAGCLTIFGYTIYRTAESGSTSTNTTSDQPNARRKNLDWLKGIHGVQDQPNEKTGEENGSITPTKSGTTTSTTQTTSSTTEELESSTASSSQALRPSEESDSTSTTSPVLERPSRKKPRT